MLTTTSSLLIAASMLAALASSAPAQWTTVRPPEHNHRAMSLTPHDHAAAHVQYMLQLQASLDTTLRRSYGLAQEINGRLRHTPEATATDQQVASRMTQHLIVLTDALHSLADELGTLMADDATVHNRTLQTDMEEIQPRLSDMASEAQKVLTAVQKMAARSQR